MMEDKTQNFSGATKADKISIPELSLPKGGGAIKGMGETFQPNPFSGTANLSIPIYVSPCRNFEPKISLDYSSGLGNGLFGIGFSLSLPSISRKTEKGIPRYADSDTFIFSNSEDLVPKLLPKDGGAWGREEKKLSQDGVAWDVTSFLPRVEGMFAKIELYQNTSGSFWKVVEKDNVTSIYGLSENARIADPDDKTRIFKWLIEKTYDAKGNKIEFFYKPEDHEHVPEKIYEQNRTRTANKYMQRIRYGNYLDEGGREAWAFEVVFDYGEYNIEEEYLSKAHCNPYTPSGNWPARMDPFSSYRSGFEIRTLRLCRNILLFHRFAEELGADPCLVRATRLSYEQSAEMSRLLAVEARGYRRTADGSYESRPLPPLAFGYSQFNPAGQEFKRLEVASGVSVPGYLSQSQFNLVDLYGDGIPGFLYSDQRATLYWRPTGNGRYGYPEAPVEFPIDRDLGKAEYSLLSLAGNGKLELVVGAPQRGGFYESNTDGSWEPYRSFASYPTDFASPQKELADVNGDGLWDILIFEDAAVKIYPSLKKDGFGPPVRASLIADEDGTFPAAGNDYGREVVTFADVFGDGLSHRVRIRDGSVECWPNLGYGRFGKKVLLGDAPRFGDGLDAARLFWADIDGSGTQDIVYVRSDRVDVFLNQGGNSFSKQPISIPLPEAYTALDEISFADVLGNGSTALIFTKMGTNISHYYYYFSGEVKPYLLIQTDNNLGATTRISYKSSVAYFFEDKKAGKEWKTKLPFPVQVVEKIESIDRISGSKLVTAFKYHDGYYDYFEREFRGFGFVEEWDTETFEAFANPGLLEDVAFDPVEKELHVPPVYTRRWYHTGACIASGSISKHYETDYYNGDPQACRMPDSTFDASVGASDAETLRQAYAALKGQKIREEVYALDQREGVSEHPYLVTETNFHVKEEQPRALGEYASFFVHEKENIAFHYERNPRDPRVQHGFILEVDSFGNVLKSCRVFYPRRAPDGLSGTVAGAPPVYPEQYKIRVTAELQRFINNTGDFWLIGMPFEQKSYEIGGADLPGESYFSFSQILEQLEEALKNPLAFEEKFTAGERQARLLSWQLHYYWNKAQDEGLPPGEITALALLHHREEAVFSPGLLKSAFN
ncbi:MAG: SpvB/TcaC N-terminal domain-containing protein, partial [Oscillospiraceae bacterium]|nr:SpvB/TcaC N-terminal domain-containing protein [Oscillospiraceae bacterium]